VLGVRLTGVRDHLLEPTLDFMARSTALSVSRRIRVSRLS
jgi:hypothetical protein